MLTDGRTDGRADGRTENRTPISHPATSRCDKKYLSRCASHLALWKNCLNKVISVSIQFSAKRTIIIAPDKRGYPQNIFLISPQNICCGYSLEVPLQGTSNEYPQHMFLWRNKKNISTFPLIKVPYLQLCARKDALTDFLKC